MLKITNFIFFLCLLGCSKPSERTDSASFKGLTLQVIQPFDTVLAGEDYVAEIWIEGNLPDDSVRIEGYGEPLPLVNGKYRFARKSNATSFDMRGFSKQSIYFYGRINRSGKDTSLKTQKVFWVQKAVGIVR